MDKKEVISVVISTRKRDDKYVNEIKKILSHPKSEVLIYENDNQYSLPELYNKGLKSETINIEKNDLISSRYLTDACENPKKTQKIIDLCFNNQLVVKEKIK